MTKVATIVLSSVLSIAATALLGPRLGLFQWTERGTSEEAAPELSATVSPAMTPRHPSVKPNWVDESLAALESDVARIEKELAAARDDIDSYRKALAKARADQGEKRQRQQAQRSREEQSRRREEQRRARENAALARQRSGPDSQLTVSGCRWEPSVNGMTTFRFTVRNSGSKYASGQAAVYLVEHDYLTGTNRSLVQRVPVELPPRSSQAFSPAWTIIEPGDEFASCVVEIDH